MMNLNQAIAYGKRIGVRFYVLNDNDCIMGRHPDPGAG